MPRRYFNWRLAIVLVIAAGALFATAYALRKWQRSTRAEEARGLGLAAFENKDWLEAAGQLGRYIGVHQDDVEALLKYAEAQLQIRPSDRQRVQQAVGAYRAVLRVEPDNIEATRQLIELYMVSGAAGEAALVAENFLKVSDNVEVRTLWASALVVQREYAQAAAELKNTIEKNPSHVPAYDMLGRLAESRPDEVDGEPGTWYDQAIQANPSSPLAFVLRAHHRLRMAGRETAQGGAVRGQTHRDAARKDVMQAENMDLSEADVRIRIADAWRRLGDIERAEAHLETLRQEQPELSTLWTLWASLALQSDSKPRMIRVAERALDALGAQPWDFMPVAIELFIRGGELDRARQCLDQYDEKAIHPATTAFLRGLLANAEGDDRNAIQFWQRAIELGHTTPTVRMMLAGAFEKTGDIPSAQRQLRDLIAEHPNHVRANLALAKLMARNADWVDALDRSRKAMQLAPDDMDAALLHLQSAVQLQTLGIQPGDAASLKQLEEQIARLGEEAGNRLDVQLLRITLAIRQRQYVRAETMLQDLKTQFPDEARVDLQQAQLAIAQDQPDQAIRYLRNAANRHPDDWTILRMLAINLAAQDDKAACEEVLLDTSKQFENSVSRREAGVLLAYYYRSWGREEGAYTLLEGLANELPDDIVIRRRLLRCEPVLADPAAAQRIIGEIKTLEGEAGWQWRYEQARYWYASKDFEKHQAEIVSLLNANIQQNPDDRDSRSLLAAVYDRIGKLQSAIALYREALADSTLTADLVVPAIAALNRAGESDEGRRILAQALQQKPDDPALLRLQLQAAMDRNEIDTAVKLLQDMLERNPDDNAAALGLALLEIQQGDFSQAAAMLDALDVKDPNSFLLSHARVQLKIRQGQSDEALALCDDLVNTHGTAAAYLLRARTGAFLGDAERAEADYNRAAELEPDDVDVRIALASFYRSQGRPRQALEAAQEALKMQPENVRLVKVGLVFAFESGDRKSVEDAEQQLRQLMVRFPNDNELKLLQARLLFGKGTRPAVEQATDILQRILAEEPTLVDAWVSLAEIQLQYGQRGQALDTALRGLSYRPNNRRLLIVRAQAEARRSPALAIPNLKEWLTKHPADAEVALQLADIYLATDMSDEAVALLEPLARSTTDANLRRRCRMELAISLYKSGRKAEAQKMFDALRQSDPSDPRLVAVQMRLSQEEEDWQRVETLATDWCRRQPQTLEPVISMAGLLSDTSDPQARELAERLLRQVLQTQPNDGPSLRLLGLLLQQTGRSAQAVEFYRKALEAEPEDVMSMNNLAWILADEQGKLQEGLQLADRGLRIVPDYADLLDTRGVIRHSLGRYAAAAEDFRRAISLYHEGSSALASSHFHLGQVLAQLGQKTEAARHLKTSLSLASQGLPLAQNDAAEAQRLLDELQEN